MVPNVNLTFDYQDKDRLWAKAVGYEVKKKSD